VRGASAADLAASLARARDAGEDVGALARTHGLNSLLYLRIEEAELEPPTGKDEWARLRTEHHAQATRQARSLAVAGEVLAAIRSAGARTVLPIKGLALAALMWPNYRARDMLDLDFLMKPEEVGAAEEAMRKLGFGPPADIAPSGPEHHHRPILAREGVAVEIHIALWSPMAMPFPSPPLEAIAGRAVTGRLCDEPFPAPCAEDCLLICAALLARDGFDVPLDRWADLHWLLTGPGPQPGFAKVREVARDWRMEGLLSVGLGFAGELLGTEYGWEAPASAAWPNTYERLRPIMWRRLLSPRTGARPRHEFAVQVARRGWRPQATPIAAAGRAVRYLGGLFASRKQRSELRDEIALRQAISELTRGPEP